MSDIAKKSAGRPRKVEVELPKADVVVQEVVKQPSSSLVATALGVAKNAAGKWAVYNFNFDPITLEVSVKEVKEEYSRHTANFKFKKIAATTVLKQKS